MAAALKSYHKQMNVIIADWLTLAHQHYPIAVQNTRTVGQEIAQLLEWLEVRTPTPTRACLEKTYLLALLLPQPFWNTVLANAFISVTHISLKKHKFFLHKLSYDFIKLSSCTRKKEVVLFMKIFLYIFGGVIVSCYFGFSISMCVDSWQCSTRTKQADIIICKSLVQENDFMFLHSTSDFNAEFNPDTMSDFCHSFPKIRMKFWLRDPECKGKPFKRTDMLHKADETEAAVRTEPH